MSDPSGDTETMQWTDAELSSAKQLRSTAYVESKLMPRTPVPLGSTPIKSTLHTPPAPMDMDHESPQLDLSSQVSKDGILEGRLEELKKLQLQCDLLESQCRVQLDRIKASYLANIEPLYAMRSRILVGENDEQARGFPDFWFTVMKEVCKRFAEEFTELDEAALKYLKDIKYTALDEPEGWKLEFFFTSNPYFSNHVLTKEVHYKKFRGGKIYTKLKGTEIKWCSGRCLTQKVVKRMSKRYLVDAPSFFNLFRGSDYYDTHDEELPCHIELCQSIIKTLIPKPLLFYMELMFPHSNQEDYAKLASKLGMEELRVLESKIGKFEKSMHEAKLAAQEDYLYLAEPLYDRRGEIVAEFLVAEAVGTTNATEELAPTFWLKAMRGEETLSQMISDHDAKVLRYLKDIRCSKIGEPNGWRFEFFFDCNPYFENAILTKEMHFSPCKGLRATSNTIGTGIRWHPNGFLALGDGQPVDKDGFLSVDAGQPVESFFNLFDGSGDDGYSDEDLRRDVLICGSIRRRIIPHATSLYFD